MLRTLRCARERPGRAFPPCFPRRGPIHEFVNVDVYVPGCPPSADTILPGADGSPGGALPGLEREDEVWSVKIADLRLSIEHKRNSESSILNSDGKSMRIIETQ